MAGPARTPNAPPPPPDFTFELPPERFYALVGLVEAMKKDTAAVAVFDAFLANFNAVLTRINQHTETINAGVMALRTEKKKGEKTKNAPDDSDALERAPAERQAWRLPLSPPPGPPKPAAPLLAPPPPLPDIYRADRARSIQQV
jgi:hypothetical protein